MMTNHPSNDELFAYRDGELDLEKRGLIEAHVLSCTACSTRLEDMSDAEGMLRQQLAEPSEPYLEEMTQSVMARVAPGAPKAAAAAKGSEAPSASPGATPEPARAGRRRSLDDEPRGRAPGLPWPAILSVVSAAAAVLVVSFILFRTPRAWLNAPKPEVVGLRKEPMQPAPTEPSTPAPADTEEPQAATEPPASNAPSQTSADRVASKDAAKNETKAKPAIGGEVALERASASTAAPGSGEVTTQSASEALPEMVAQREADARREAGSTEARALSKAATAPAPAAAAAPSGAGQIGESEFAPLAARYGLPTLFDPDRVSHDALLRAEPEIRVLYQTGHSGADSARVRLYLAEAARLRAGDSPDAATFDAIVHHYRRAVELARDPETARMARKRLDDFVSRTAPPR